jgi:hypothetical protein
VNTTEWVTSLRHFCRIDFGTVSIRGRIAIIAAKVPNRIVDFLVEGCMVVVTLGRLQP